MYFEIENHQDAEKVAALLKKENIAFEQMDSAHKAVVRIEVDFVSDDVYERLEEYWEEEGFTEEQIQEHVKIVETIMNDIKKNPATIVNEDCSFESVQSAIEDRIYNKLKLDTAL